MSKNKKVIIIALVVILVIALVSILIYFISKNNSKSDTAIQETSKVNKLYEELKNKEAFSFTLILDSNNKMHYAKKNNKAYLDTIYDAKESKYIIKDGNSYLLMDDYEKYYTYKNNETNLERITEQLSSIMGNEMTKGKEEINGKKYDYEEYKGSTNLTFKDLSDTNEENIKTRFYFDGNDLVYIKNIINDEQELLGVKISNDVDENLFEIPKNYQEG